MMKRTLGMLSVFLLVFSVASFAQGIPSAKFAATWTTEPGLASVAYVLNTDEDAIMLDADLGYTLATIKVPQDKELLVGVSAEIGLITDTSVKGKEGGSARAMAGAAGWVAIFAVPKYTEENAEIAAPGPIMLSGRFQALDATLGGVFDYCDETGCYFTEEEIGLLLATCAAHHFNFVLPNMDQGVYDIKAYFLTGALAAVDIDELSIVPEGATAEGSAFAAAVIGKTMLTVQQVRAAEGGVIDSEIQAP